MPAPCEWYDFRPHLHVRNRPGPAISSGRSFSHVQEDTNALTYIFLELMSGTHLLPHSTERQPLKHPEFMWGKEWGAVLTPYVVHSKTKLLDPLCMLNPHPCLRAYHFMFLFLPFWLLRIFLSFELCRVFIFSSLPSVSMNFYRGEAPCVLTKESRHGVLSPAFLHHHSDVKRHLFYRVNIFNGYLAESV